MVAQMRLRSKGWGTKLVLVYLFTSECTGAVHKITIPSSHGNTAHTIRFFIAVCMFMLDKIGMSQGLRTLLTHV
uniref:Putative secreted protein n=1 Tax=Ixodes ricinus TaxID=34613 RepID=A0A147BPE3_IXORI